MSEAERFEQLSRQLTEVAECSKRALVAITGDTTTGHIGIAEQVKTVMDRQKTIHDDVHLRLNKVEREADKEKWFHRGMAAGIGTAGGALGHWLKSLGGH